MSALSKTFVPKNTQRMTKWSVSNFLAWMTNCNKLVSVEREKCPESLLELKDPMLLNTWLGAFVAETSKVNGDPYPPKTLYEILCGLLRHARLEDPSFPNFLDKNDARFSKLHNVIDSVFRKLRADGVSSVKKSAKPFTKEEEAKLWESDVLGIQDPTSLQ